MRLGVFGSWLFALAVGACAATPAAAPPVPVEPAITATTSSPAPTSLQCGVFNVFVERTAATGFSIYQLVSPTGVSMLHFTWKSNRPPHPDFGTYICAQFMPGTPDTVFVSLVAPGEPGYIARP